MLVVSFLIFGCVGVLSSGSRKPCPLQWVPSGNGRVPLNAVKSGVKNFVARAFLDNPREVLGGHINLMDGPLHVAHSNGSILQFERYSVLTNPENCSLSWAPVTSESFDPTDPLIIPLQTGLSSFIGRAVMDATTRGGATVPDSSLFRLNTEDKISVRHNYDLLISEEPLLHAFLSEFSLSPDLNGIEGASFLQLFAVTTFLLEDTSAITLFSQTREDVREYFDFFEEHNNIPVNWDMMKSLSIHNLMMWYGGPTIMVKNLPLQREDLPTFGFRLQRDRTLETETNFTLTSDPDRKVKASCSYAVIAKDVPVPFTVKAVFSSGKGENVISQEHIQRILEESGRDVTSFVNLPRGRVQATLSGTISGRFVLRTHYIRRNGRDDISACDLHLAI